MGRDSQAQRLGVKIADGQRAESGNIIIRQRGTKYRPGKNVLRAGDDTLLAATNGIVKFSHKKVRKFHGSLEPMTFVNVVPK